MRLFLPRQKVKFPYNYSVGLEVTGNFPAMC